MDPHGPRCTLTDLYHTIPWHAIRQRIRLVLTCFLHVCACALFLDVCRYDASACAPGYTTGACIDLTMALDKAQTLLDDAREEREGAQGVVAQASSSNVRLRAGMAATAAAVVISALHGW